MSRTIEAIIKHTGVTSDKKSTSATSQTMKAIRIHNYGGPEALQYEDAPRPEPQAGEVLVRVHAAGVNPIDWKIREGYMKDFWPHKFPLILGWDTSGTVEEVGPGVSRFKIGDEVYSVSDPTRDGAYADYIVVRQAELALKPNSLHHVRAFGGADSVAITLRHCAIAARPARVDSRRERRCWSLLRATRKMERRARFRNGFHQESGFAARTRSRQSDRLHAAAIRRRRAQHRHCARHHRRGNAGTVLVSFEKGWRSRFVSPAAVGRESRRTRRPRRICGWPPERWSAR
jgi:hypothetical protein